MTALQYGRVLCRSVKSRWMPTLLLVLFVVGFAFIRVSTFVATDVHPASVATDVHPASVVRDSGPTALPVAGTGVDSRKMILESADRDGGRLEEAIRRQKTACPSVVRPKQERIKYQNGYWQRHGAGAEQIFVWSAFYDDRPIVGLLPLVRAQVVDTVQRPVHCQVWYSGYEHPYVTPAVVTLVGRGDVIGGVRYKQELYSCPLPVSHPIPSHVSFVTGPCQNSTIFLRLTVPVRSDWDREFGVCVAIAFGRMPTVDFVEWIELNRLLGVAEFNVYDGNLSPNMSRLLDYYVEKGVLRVFSMPPPVTEFTLEAVKLASAASLNDCMMRNVYRYRYVVVIDFDEVIVPRRQRNYTELLRAVDAAHRLPHPWQSYTFRNAYFFSHFPDDDSQPGHLKTMRRRYRIEPSRFLYAAKSFIDPRSCLSVFNHYCWKRFPLLDKPWTIDVNTSLALSHHYRKCNWSKKKCDASVQQRLRDDVMLRYKHQLDLNVRSALKDLNYGI